MAASLLVLAELSQTRACGVVMAPPPTRRVDVLPGLLRELPGVRDTGRYNQFGRAAGFRPARPAAGGPPGRA